MAHNSKTTVRRSVALPADLVDDVLEATRADEPRSFNALVRELLEDYIERRKARLFAAKMEEMANDPAIARESSAMTSDFSATDNDGLEDL